MRWTLISTVSDGLEVDQQILQKKYFSEITIINKRTKNLNNLKK